jgi:FkbM family methyltransferase
MWYDEPSVSRFMSTVRGELYVDVGASFGHYLRALSSNFRRMIAIEADPAIFKFLTESSPVNCKPINVAVAEKAGFAEFHVPAGQYNFGVGSLLPLEQRAAWVAPTNYRSFTVRTTTLDSILSAERDVDLIKVDVEGAEMLVLAGATHVMKNIARWLIEIHNPTERRAIVRLMTRHGYHSMKLDDRHYIFEQKIER